MKSGTDGHIQWISRLSDFPRDDAVYVGTVRSPVSRGVISSISLPHLPKGYRSITADDIPGSKTIGVQGAMVPVLASGEVAYRGEPVALIVGPDRRKVAEAITLTRVRVDETRAEYASEVYDSTRIVKSTVFERGNADTALAESAHIVEGEYRVGPQDHYYPEPQGSAAAFDYDKLVVFSSTQWPFHVRSSVADVLGVKPHEIVVRTTILGPHLDGKLWYPSLLASHAALAAMLSGQPALLLLSRNEDFLYTTKRAPSLASYRAGMDAEGALTALDVRVTLNTGAYSPFVDVLVERALRACTGAYSCPVVRTRVTAIRSDLPPMGAFTGFGTAPVTFAVERLAEDCSTAMDIDPSEWRGINVAGKGDETAGAALRKAPPFTALQERILANSDYPRKRSSFELIRKRRADPSTVPGFGIGLAFAAQMNAGGFGKLGQDSPSVEITMSKGSMLTIRTSVVPGTTTTTGIWGHVAANTLGLSPDAVRVEAPSTDRVPDSGPSVLSRSVSVIERLIELACKELSSRRFREALPITVRKSVRARSRAASPESPLEDASWGCAVVELELDPVDGYPDVRGIWLVVKAGRLLSPEAAHRALEHDAIVALGLCTHENLDVSSGPADEEAAARYRLHRLKDAPPVYVDFLEDDSEPKGIGELAYDLIPPAFANALSQALDSPWNSLPIGDLATPTGVRQ
ncbi:MAG: xanthine dehydrogenase family protein [Spirochaetales bacterium]|nr:xanthine dehydrogenase family protein [Spirochaetales bacterium]